MARLARTVAPRVERNEDHTHVSHKGTFDAEERPVLAQRTGQVQIGTTTGQNRIPDPLLKPSTGDVSAEVR